MCRKKIFAGWCRGGLEQQSGLRAFALTLLPRQWFEAHVAISLVLSALCFKIYNNKRK